MSTSTVNISFQKELLELIDEVAKAEARTRSDLIREAARMYIERKNRWNMIFEMGSRLAEETNLTEDDVIDEIRINREEKGK